MAFARFTSGTAGRWVGAIAGTVLIVPGFFVMGGTFGTVVGVVGFVSLAACARTMRPRRLAPRGKRGYGPG